MNNVLLIVRRELGSYLRTPSGYVIAAVILLLEGLFFNGLAVGSEPRLSSDVLRWTLWICAWCTGLAAVLFSMRLLAEERSTGTQVLLFTSPIREGEIVFGKYLASLAFLTAIVLMSLYLPALIFVNGKVSYGHIASGYLGMFLLGATVLAIGMFASSLVKHPFFAVLLTLAFGGLLEVSWEVASTADGSLRDVLGYLSLIRKHFVPFRDGLFQLSDVVFYVSLIYFSLLAATRVLKSQRWQ